MIENYTLTLSQEQFELVQQLVVYEDMRFDNLKSIELPATLLKERELKEQLVLDTLKIICQAKLDRAKANTSWLNKDKDTEEVVTNE